MVRKSERNRLKLTEEKDSTGKSVRDIWNMVENLNMCNWGPQSKEDRERALFEEIMRIFQNW